MSDYKAQLRAIAEAARQDHQTTQLAQRNHLRSAKPATKPLTQQIEELMRSLPPAQRERPWTMAELVSRLEGKYHQHPSAGDVGQALRALGWARRRDWSAAADGRRVWVRTA